MKIHEAKTIAEDIGNDSWQLISFMQLPNTATKEEQVNALRSDQTWQQNHIDIISSQIDELISAIED